MGFLLLHLLHLLHLLLLLNRFFTLVYIRTEHVFFFPAVNNMEKSHIALISGANFVVDLKTRRHVYQVDFRVSQPLVEINWKPNSTVTTSSRM